MPKSKKVGPKKVSYKKAKTEAWSAFSRYIRARDCIETTGSPEMGECFTCGNVHPFAKLQAGHFVSRTSMSLFFDETNVHAQCYACNIIKSGNYIEYTMKMINLYGKGFVDNLLLRKMDLCKYSSVELLEVKEEYQRKYDLLIKPFK